MCSRFSEVRNLTVQFPAAQGSVTAVRDVSFQIAPGEVLGLVEGESGSGKSVSALAILRLLPPQAHMRGEIGFRGHGLVLIPEAQMRRIRGAGIGVIFQEPMTALNPVMHVGDQMARGGAGGCRPGSSGAKAQKSLQRFDAVPKARSTAGAEIEISAAEARNSSVSAQRNSVLEESEKQIPRS